MVSLYVTSYLRESSPHSTGNAVDLVGNWDASRKNWQDKSLYYATYYFLLERLRSGLILFNDPELGNWHFHLYLDGRPATGGTEFTKPGGVATRGAFTKPRDEMLKDLFDHVHEFSTKKGSDPFPYTQEYLGLSAPVVINPMSKMKHEKANWFASAFSVGAIPPESKADFMDYLKLAGVGLGVLALVALSKD